jgi:hypothetical protein
MVTYQQTETMPKVGTKKYQVDESKNVLVSLSCYAGTAAQGEPGYFTSDPTARQFQQNNTAAAGQR